MSKWHNFVTIQDTDMYVTSFLFCFVVVVVVFQNFTETANLHKSARAKITDNVLLMQKMLILCLFESRQSQVSKQLFSY